MTSKNYPAEFQKLQDKYLAEFPQKITAIEGFIENQDRPNMSTLFHKLKGNGLTYGFAEVTEIARLMDQHHKRDTPHYFELAKLGLKLLKIIYPSMQKKESIPLDSIPEYLTLKGELK